MKKKFVGLLAVVMVLSLSIPAYATESVEVDEEEILRAINALDDDFQNEVGCSTEFICIEADENDYQADEYMNCNTRETSVPTEFYNIGPNGIYKGAFSGLRGTMYTSKYFDIVDGAYHSRVRCYGNYPSLSYKVGNYCVTCKKVLSTSEEYYTPTETYQYGSWTSFGHTVNSSHASHFMCPFVVNTSGLINGQMYAIGGDIWVNYTNSWS